MVEIGNKPEEEESWISHRKGLEEVGRVNSEGK
jgi:hypothetical protein